jgi:hypothetical protein
MRFKQLAGWTGLPIDTIRSAFHGEDVRTVLPVHAEQNGAETVLVATSAALAIVTGEDGPRGSRWLTRWAPWDVVHISGSVEAGLTVYVGRFTFVASLPGEQGQRALRDFLRAAPFSAGPAPGQA